VSTVSLISAWLLLRINRCRLWWILLPGARCRHCCCLRSRGLLFRFGVGPRGGGGFAVIGWLHNVGTSAVRCYSTSSVTLEQGQSGFASQNLSNACYDILTLAIFYFVWNMLCLDAHISTNNVIGNTIHSHLPIIIKYMLY
jgi:hypothetical protein